MAAKFDPKAKAKRQKIIAGVLGVVFLGVLAFQAPTILGAFGGGSSEVATEPSPTPAPAPTPVSPGGAPVAAPGAPPSAALVDTDPALAPADGQLLAFDQFESKDPFVQQVDERAGSGGSAPASKEDGKQPDKGTTTEDKGPTLEPKDAASPPTDEARPKVATIAVNGEEFGATVGGTFPEDDALFKLVSVGSDSVKVGIAGGSYANGSQTITLRKGGKPVTLMNTADGTTYVLRLVSVG